MTFELDSSLPKTFRFEASQGDVIEFAITHRSTSLKASITSPSGKRNLSLISPTLFTGKMPIPFRVSEDGVHILRIEAERPGKTVGTVDAEFISKRRPSDTDGNRLKAFSLISEAQQTTRYLYRLFIDRTPREAAKSKFKEAIRVCEALADLRCISIAALELGRFEGDEFADFSASEAAFRKSLDAYSKISDVGGEALAKAELAFSIFFSRGRDPEVIPLFDSALALAKSISDPLMEARILILKGDVLNDLGEGGKGFELQKQALVLSGTRDLEGNFKALYVATSIAGLLGDRSSSIYAEQSMDVLRSIEGKIHPHVIPHIINKKAGMAAARKDWKAFDTYTKQMVDAAESIGQKRLFARFLWAAGIDYLDYKQREKARPYLERALKIYEEAIPREAQAIYSALGRYHFETGNYSQARELFQKAVDLNIKNEDKYAETSVLLYLVDAELKLGYLTEAFRHAEKAYNYSITLRGNYYTAVSLNGFDLTFLRESAERMIKVLHRLYTSTRDDSYLNRALEIQETAVSRGLINTVRNIGFDITSAIDPELIRRISDLQAKISDLELAMRETPKNGTEVNSQLLMLLVRYDDLLEEVRRKNPNASLFNELIHLSADRIKDLLDDDTALVQFSVKSDESHVWVIGKTTSQFYALGSGNNINDLSVRFVAELSNYASANQSGVATSGKRLFEAIIRPILKDLHGFKRVVIVPDGNLVSIPFGAIPIPQKDRVRYFAEEYEIAVLPSVTTLVALKSIRRDINRPGDGRLIALITDPVFDSSDERLKDRTLAGRGEDRNRISQTIAGSTVKSLTRLPFTSVEARQISAIAGDRSTRYQGLDASRDNVISGKLSDYRILHFATHGFINSANPELSSLALSMYDPAGRPTNGFLRAIDIYSLTLNSELVVLSGCQTAGLAGAKGDSLTGLTRGFMYAGVPTVMASLWKVDDSATAYFMRHFYEALLQNGDTPTAALRHAQMKFINSPRWKAPKYWAAFTVQGEYKTTFK